MQKVENPEKVQLKKEYNFYELN
jgi:succinate-acetate transporter protein